MAGQMVWCQIQESRAIRMKFFDGLKLVTRQLQRVNHAGAIFHHRLQEWFAKVPTGYDAKSRNAQQMGEQIRGGTFSVGAGDGQNAGSIGLGTQGTMRQLNLTNDGYAPLKSLRYEGDAWVDAGAQDNLGTVIQQRERMITPNCGYTVL